MFVHNKTTQIIKEKKWKRVIHKREMTITQKSATNILLCSSLLYSFLSRNEIQATQWVTRISMKVITLFSIQYSFKRFIIDTSSKIVTKFIKGKRVPHWIPYILYRMIHIKWYKRLRLRIFTRKPNEPISRTNSFIQSNERE